MIKLKSLENGIEIRSLPTDLFETLTKQLSSELFDSNQYYFSPKKFYSEEETQKATELKRNMGNPLRINLGAFRGEDLIGWSWGVQETSEVFYVVNSAVIPKERNRGIYSALVTAMLKELSAQGFQIAYSRHVATNNAVLIPKLKAGFTISSLELSDQYGVLVHLKWFAHPLRRKVMDFRAGGIGFDEELKSTFNIQP